MNKEYIYNDEGKSLYDEFWKLDRLEKALKFREQKFLMQYSKFNIVLQENFFGIYLTVFSIGEGLKGFYPMHRTRCLFKYDFIRKKGFIDSDKYLILNFLKEHHKWEFLKSLEFERCLSMSVVRDILSGKLTSVDAVIRAYFKSLGIKGYSGKELSRILEFGACMIKAIAVFEIDRLIPALRNKQQKGILMKQEDIIEQAYWLGIKLNPFWSEKRFHEEHQKLTQILMKHKLEKMDSYPVWDLPEKFEYFGLQRVKLLNTERSVFEEAAYMHHCLYTNYWNRIRNKIYVAFNILLPSGDRATLGIRKSGIIWEFDQCYKKYDKRLGNDDMDYVKFITDKICTIFP